LVGVQKYPSRSRGATLLRVAEPRVNPLDGLGMRPSSKLEFEGNFLDKLCFGKRSGHLCIDGNGRDDRPRIVIEPSL